MDETIFVLHHKDWQFSKLVIRSTDDVEIIPTDNHADKKTNSSPQKSLFEKINSSDSIELELAVWNSIEKDGAELFNLVWGPYHYSYIPSGEYNVHVEWQSTINTYVDDSGDTRALEGVWLGTLKSNKVLVQLK